jgi:hypothetical protein
MPCRVFEGCRCSFGGAGAVLRQADGTLVAAADPAPPGGRGGRASRA